MLKARTWPDATGRLWPDAKGQDLARGQTAGSGQMPSKAQDCQKQARTWPNAQGKIWPRQNLARCIRAGSGQMPKANTGSGQMPKAQIWPDAKRQDLPKCLQGRIQPDAKG